MRGISWLAEDLLASQEGLCFTELVGRSVSQSVSPISMFLWVQQMCLITPAFAHLIVRITGLLQRHPSKSIALPTPYPFLLFEDPLIRFTPGCTAWDFSFTFPQQNLVCISVLPIHATGPGYCFHIPFMNTNHEALHCAFFFTPSYPQAASVV